jgi:hypothetical protein
MGCLGYLIVGVNGVQRGMVEVLFTPKTIDGTTDSTTFKS